MLDRLLPAVDNWLKDRPTMDANNTPHGVLQLLCGEVAELCEAADKLDSSELSTSKDFEQELCDVLLFTLSLFRQMGKNAVDCAMEKIAFNMIRNPAGMYQGSMDFHDTRKWAKERERRLDLKGEFYAQAA